MATHPREACDTTAAFSETGRSTTGFNPWLAKGQGLWRASDFSAALVSGPHVFGRPTGIRGRDFVTRCTSATTPFTRAEAPDLVRASNLDDGILADPDPFEVESGNWVVFHGRSDANTSTPTPGPTGAVAGDRSDAVVEVSDGRAPLEASPLSGRPSVVWPP